MIILTIILVALLFGNWLINETWLFIPIDLFGRLTSLGWWDLQRNYGITIRLENRSAATNIAQITIFSSGFCSYDVYLYVPRI